MKTSVTFCAPYVDDYSGEKRDFVYEYKVPTTSFEKIQEVLTKQLKAEYCASKHSFTFASREDLYQGLEKVAHLIVVCRSVTPKKEHTEFGMLLLYLYLYSSTSFLIFDIKSSSPIAPISPSDLERTPTAFASTSLSPIINIYGIF